MGLKEGRQRRKKKDSCTPETEKRIRINEIIAKEWEGGGYTIFQLRHTAARYYTQKKKKKPKKKKKKEKKRKQRHEHKEKDRHVVYTKTKKRKEK